MSPRLTPTRALLLLLWALGLWLAYQSSRPLIPAPVPRPAGDADRERLSANPDLEFGRVNALGTPVGRYPNLYYGLVRARFTPEYGEELLFWEEQTSPLAAAVLEELATALDGAGVQAALTWLQATVEHPGQHTPQVLTALAFRLGYLGGDPGALQSMLREAWQAQTHVAALAFHQGNGARDPQAALAARGWPGVAGAYEWQPADSQILIGALRRQPRGLFRAFGTLLEQGTEPPGATIYTELLLQIGQLDLSLSQINPYWLDDRECITRLQSEGATAWNRLASQPPASTPVIGGRDLGTWQRVIHEGWLSWCQSDPASALSHWRERPNTPFAEPEVRRLYRALHRYADENPEAFAAWERGLESRVDNDPLHTLRLERLSGRDWILAHEELRRLVDPAARTHATVVWCQKALAQPRTDKARLAQLIQGSPLINPELKSDLLGYLQTPERARPAAARALERWRAPWQAEYRAIPHDLEAKP